MHICIYGILDCAIFITELFNAFKIKINEKLFILISLFSAIIVILIVNIIPIQKTKEHIVLQEKICNIIDSNKLTYKNIQKELGIYIPEEDKESNTLEADIAYQAYTNLHRWWMSQISSYIDNIANKKDVKNNLRELEAASYQLSTNFIENEKVYCRDKVILILTSIISVIIICSITLMNKEKTEK